MLLNKHIDQRLEQQFTTADMKGVTRWYRKRNENLYRQIMYRQNNMLHVVQAINKNKLQWLSHVTRREEGSMLRVVMKLKMKGKRLRGRPRLKPVFHGACFEAVSAPTLYAPYPRRVRPYPVRIRRVQSRRRNRSKTRSMENGLKVARQHR